MTSNQATVEPEAAFDTPEFEDIDLFAEGLDDRLNASGTSCFASGTSISTASGPCGCFCSFGCISSGCCG